MKQILLLTAWVFFASILPKAQASDSFVNYELQINSADKIQRISLFHRYSASETVSGYFYIEKDTRLLGGKYHEGGFDFIDDQFSSVPKNYSFNTPESCGNLDNILKTVNMDKICSFQIIPNPADLSKDSFTALIKYSVYLRKGITEQTSINTANFEISTHAEIVNISRTGHTNFDFLSAFFPGYAISLTVQRIQSPNYLDAKSCNKVLMEISQLKPSTWQNELQYDFSCEFIRTANLGQITNGFPPRLYTRLHQEAMQHNAGIFNRENNSTRKIGTGIYSTEFNFPFQLFNAAKEQLYRNYLSYQNIAQSKVCVYVVPESLSMDTLYADVYVTYTKIDLDDIQRWSPIKKHLALPKGEQVFITLPKENWNAVFTRSNEKYEIYGYSDYEKHVNEYICLTLNSVSK